MIINNMLKNWNKTIDNAVRDICAIPVSKSKVRRIISSLLEEQKKEDIKLAMSEDWYKEVYTKDFIDEIKKEVLEEVLRELDIYSLKKGQGLYDDDVYDLIKSLINKQ